MSRRYLGHSLHTTQGSRPPAFEAQRSVFSRRRGSTAMDPAYRRSRHDSGMSEQTCEGGWYCTASLVQIG
eukprot:763373-Hanusia_phi.AAC.7